VLKLLLMLLLLRMLHPVLRCSYVCVETEDGVQKGGSVFRKVSGVEGCREVW
jgi:hypothetical protein